MFSQLLLSIAILIYTVFTVTTMYFCFVGKRAPQADLIGRVIWYHGVAWIIGMIAVVVLTMAFIFANILMNVINMKIYFG